MLNQGAWATLTVYPTASGKTISGTIAGPLIKLNGADNVTIDGSYNGTTQSLTFSNDRAINTNYTIALFNFADNNTIKNCRIYSKYRSITTTIADNTLIEGNEIFGDVLGNTLTQQSGIYLTTNTTNAKVRRNNIHDIHSTTAISGISWGICYRSGSTTETEISNNVIYAINGWGNDKSVDCQLSGICIYLGGNIKIFNNTIYLSGNLLGKSGSTGGSNSSCIYVVSDATNLDIRNNILYNAMGRNPTNTSISINTFQIYSAAPKTAFTNINANDYYYTDQPDVSEYVGYLGGKITDLDGWKTATGQDAGSYSTDPHFTSATNLKPIAGNFLNGEYIEAVTTDYEGVTRNNPPHIGAYEGSASGRWLGGTSTDWATPDNWDNSVVPEASDNVTIRAASLNMPHITSAPASPAVCNNLTIESGAVVTVEKGKAMTVGGTITNNTEGGVVIESDGTGTGSLIMGASAGSGSATAARYMTTDAWHLVAPPLSGQTISGFLTANSNIPEKAGARGMMDYNPATNVWNGFFTNETAGSLAMGNGYGMRTATSSAVTFTGQPSAGHLTLTGLVSGKWNCVGNPYTSALAVNTNTGKASTFLDDNAVLNSNIDPGFGAIYIWDKGDSQNDLEDQYAIINNASEALYIQQGQAFMIKMNTGATSVVFFDEMQDHFPTLPLKSTDNSWARIKLYAKSGNRSGFTQIAFNSAMTRGLDPTYDAGLLKGSTNLAVYTRLVDDNGFPFAIQALPNNGFDTMVIPVGLDFIAGGEVTFSAELQNLSPDCQPILEDMLTHTFTDLTIHTYTVAIPANSTITDRFRLHTSKLSTGLNNEISGNELSVFAVKNTGIRIIGLVTANTLATLYDMQGRVVVQRKLVNSDDNIVPTTNLSQGIYLLSLTGGTNPQQFKIQLSE